MSIYKSLFNEASFSPERIVKILTLFNKVLEKRTKKQFYGNPNFYDDIQNKRGKFHVITYDFGAGQSIKYLISFSASATISYIDFYLTSYSDIPTFQTDDISQLNIVKLVDLVSDTIINKKPSEMPILIESKKSKNKLSEGSFNLKDFVLALQGSAYTQRVKKFLAQNINKGGVDKLVIGKNYTELTKLYNKWAKANKEKPMAEYTMVNIINTGLIQAGIEKGAVVKVSAAKDKKSKNIPMAIDTRLEALMANADKYKGTPNEMYTQLEDYVEDIVKGDAYGLLIAGDPGIGKTFRMKKKLKTFGLSPMDANPKLEKEPVIEEVEDEETGEIKEVNKGFTWVKPVISPKEYLYVKGTATPKTVYGYGYLCGKNLLVFDDTDSALTQHPNLIKAMLENNRSRKVDWGTSADLFDQGEKSLIPGNYMYEGKVIFITNKYLNEIDSAVLSRSQVVEINFTADEVLGIVKELLPALVDELNKEFNTKVTLKMAQTTYEYCVEIKEDYSKLDLRTFQQCVKDFAKGSPDWKKRIGRILTTKKPLKY